MLAALLAGSACLLLLIAVVAARLLRARRARLAHADQEAAARRQHALEEADRRDRALRAKYSPDEDLAHRLITRIVWKGETAEQLRDSFGPPAALDSLSSETAPRELWKYHPAGEGHYYLQVTLEYGLVTSWSQEK
jgi:hypothetical protein